MITVFTPVFNRAYIINELYKSLIRQRMYDFEWLIVDDGSTDELQDLVELWHSNNPPFDIRYYYQENGGKHRAINRGVALARGDAFFIVDSDDYLLDDAIANISGWWQEIRDDESFAGVSGLKITANGFISGGNPTFLGYVDATNLEREIYCLGGDKAEVYKTEILRKYTFPEFDGERFMPEGIVWNHIAYDGYKMRWYNIPTYVYEYREDGLTYKGLSIYVNNPVGYGYYLRKSSLFFGWSEQRKFYEYYKFYLEYMKLYVESEFDCEKYLEMTMSEFELYHRKHDICIEKTCEKLGNNIAIYGVGKRGREVINFYSNTDVNILYIMDKKKYDLPYVQMDIMSELPEVDCIIVTPKNSEDNIIEVLNSKTKAKVISYSMWLEIIGIV